jgi:tRNA nucleotidyltransferase/poly(A) polymerase
MKFYKVGGCNRDFFMGVKSKDVDFAVEAPSFQEMKDQLISDGFKIFIENEEFLTIRAKVPVGNPLASETDVADFVMCRKDGPSSDGRRPDFVEAGTILDDLARRDFTVNAIAQDVETGEFIDPFDGIKDVESRQLVFVGNPFSRIEEDGLRVLRAFRFEITKNLDPVLSTDVASRSNTATKMLSSVSIERIREEINLMLNFDTIATLRKFSTLSDSMMEAIFRDGLRLESTLKK